MLTNFIRRSFSSHNNNNKILTAECLYQGLLNGERQSLARAITLVESTHPTKAKEANKLLNLVEAKLDPCKPTSFRLGLSGPPGAGINTSFGSS